MWNSCLPGNCAASQRIFNVLPVEMLKPNANGIGIFTSNLDGLANSVEKLALNWSIVPAISGSSFLAMILARFVLPEHP